MEAMEQFLADEAVRQDFYGRLRAFSRCLHISLSSEKVLDLVDEGRIATMKRNWRSFTSASKADRIASATRRAITGRMDLDPAFYERFSRLLEETFEEYRRKRSNETAQNDMRNTIDDRFYDVLRDEKGIELTEARMNDLLAQIMRLAQARFP